MTSCACQIENMTIMLYAGVYSGMLIVEVLVKRTFRCSKSFYGHVLWDKCHLTTNILAFTIYGPFPGDRNSKAESGMLLGGKIFTFYKSGFIPRKFIERVNQST